MVPSDDGLEKPNASQKQQGGGFREKMQLTPTVETPTWAPAAAAAPQPAAASAPAPEPVSPNDGTPGLTKSASLASVASVLSYPEADDVQITVAPGEPASSNWNQKDGVPVLVTLTAHGEGVRMPADFCCILDTSGSMGMEARIQSEGGASESHGLSLLDIAKHGVRTIIHMLSEEDRLSIVAFHHTARTVLELTKMDSAGQKLAETELNKLMHGGGTHIWHGLQVGLESLRKDNTQRQTNKLTGNGSAMDQYGRLSHLVLLSDGESLERDMIIPRLKEYKQKHGQLQCTLNTFGFGYNIDSRLLSFIGDFGEGSYSFIPDAGFVGTAFVNTLGNLLATMAKDVEITLKPEEGAKILKVCGLHGVSQEEKDSSGALVIKLGTLQYGQTKDLIVRMSAKGKSSSYLTVRGKYTSVLHDGPKSVHKCDGPTAVGDLKTLHAHVCRSDAVDTMFGLVERVQRRPDMSMPWSTRGRMSIVPVSYAQPVKKRSMVGRMMSFLACGGNKKKYNGTPSSPSSPSFAPEYNQMTTPEEASASLEVAQEEIRKLAERIKASPAASTDRVQALLADILGQVTEAFSQEGFYWKWGCHYVPSVACAHKMQQCNNFKDQGVQHYGGELFTAIRDQADDVFDNLPAPKPSIRIPQEHGSAPQAPINMAQYNDRFAG